jgi:beta-xylosidase
VIRHLGETDLWAAEVLYHAGTFYMYVAGTRIKADGHGVESARRQGPAVGLDRGAQVTDLVVTAR